MNTFTQHVPRFVDTRGCNVVPIPFKTVQTLYDIPHVKLFYKRPDFSHFALSEHHLMAVLDSGYMWWVVGFIKDPDDVDLPQWEGAVYDAEMQSGERKHLTSEDVISSCGDVLTLRDGTKALNLRY